MGRYYFFIVVVLCSQITLCIADHTKLIDPVPGFMISGSLYAFVAANNCGQYEAIFEFFAMIMFAFTFFFVSMPHIVKWRRKQAKNNKKDTL